MSWLSDFTSKAENFLNKIDESAASTLNESSLSNQSDSHVGEIAIPKATPITPLPVHSTVPHDEVKRRSSEKSGLESPNKKGDVEKVGSSSLATSKKKQDDMLFQFLNSVAPATNESKHGHNRSYSGTTPSAKSHVLTKKSSSVENLYDQSNYKSASSVTQVNTSNESTKQEETQEVKTPQSTEEVKHNDSSERVSNLELENTLLKNELKILNEDLAANMKKLKEQQDETEKFQKRYDTRRNRENEEYERLRADFMARENDLNEALNAKDSQLAVLRVRIQEADIKLQEQTQALQDYKNTIEMLVKDQQDVTGFQGDTLEQFKARLEETESQLQKEVDEHKHMKSELIDLQSKLQSEQHQSAELIKQLHNKENEEKGKYREFEMNVKNSKNAAEGAQKELAEYKEKAARILQAKEKLIASLKQGCEVSGGNTMLLLEIEAGREERQVLVDQLNQAKYDNEQLRAEYQELESTLMVDREEKDDRIENLQLSLKEEMQKRNNAEEDMKRYMQELQVIRDEERKTKKANVAMSQQHETEINQLKSQLSLKRSQSCSEEELENRLRTLTENLIQKQTMIEALSTEKNSLHLQLERLEKQYTDIQNSLVKRQKASNQSDIHDIESGSNIAPIASVMPAQITRNRHWKKTVNQIDKISIQIGVFLRRYPAARLLVLLYVALLHLWVTFVLLTYSPEIHTDHESH